MSEHQTTTPVFDLATFRDATLAVVAELGPDTVYTPPGSAYGCVYVYEGRPACLIGHALIRLGVSVDELEALTELDSDGYPQGSKGAKDLPYFDELAGGWAHYAQNCQDSGETWGAAVAHADEKCGVTA